MTLITEQSLYSLLALPWLSWIIYNCLNCLPVLENIGCKVFLQYSLQWTDENIGWGSLQPVDLKITAFISELWFISLYFWFNYEVWDKGTLQRIHYQLSNHSISWYQLHVKENSCENLRLWLLVWLVFSLPLLTNSRNFTRIVTFLLLSRQYFMIFRNRQKTLVM